MFINLKALGVWGFAADSHLESLQLFARPAGGKVLALSPLGSSFGPCNLLLNQGPSEPYYATGHFH